MTISLMTIWQNRKRLYVIAVNGFFLRDLPKSKWFTINTILAVRTMSVLPDEWFRVPYIMRTLDILLFAPSIRLCAATLFQVLTNIRFATTDPNLFHICGLTRVWRRVLVDGRKPFWRYHLREDVVRRDDVYLTLMRDGTNFKCLLI